MKRSRRRPHPPKDLGIAADVATDDTTDRARPPRGNRYAGMRLPHERDESTHRPGEPDPVTKRAAKDLEDGQQDTDCYGAVGERFDHNADER